MGVQDLQTFLDSNCLQGGVITVDLLKTARNVLQRHRNRAHKNPNQPLVRLKLVFDAECCLDRFYGGYFSDWACGGQWNRMVEFLASFIQNFDFSGGEVIVFFNGCNEPSRRDEWIQNQLKMRMKVNSVIKHITTKGTPPPKIWWTPPACLRTALRLALRHLKMTVVCSMDDHHQEVIAYIRENSCHGLVADDAEYAIFDPPRYFSSEQMKLTYKRSLDTKEYLMSVITRSLGITLDRLCILGALLGNYILTEHELIDFYEKLGITATGPNKTNIDVSIKTIATFVKELPSTAIDTVAEKVFGSTSDPRYSKLRQSVQYYINGTRQGFLRYKTAKSGGKSSKDESKQTTSPPKNAKNSTAASEENCKNLEPSKFASETVESERESLNAYNEATGLVKATPHIVIEAPAKTETNGDQENNKPEEEQTNDNGVNGAHNNLILSPSSSSNSSSATSPSHATTDSDKSTEKTTSIPSTVPEVMRTASERHQKGLMSPYIYQILVNGEIKLPVLLEDENHRETPSIHVVYRPARQMVYAILFNLHHRNYLATKAKENNDDEKIEVPDVIIKEWVWSKANPYENPEYVKAEPLGWGVPTIQRLWFGTGIDDKRRRLRAYLTCMRSDTPLMLNTSYVPQHLLVMASVIRYIMSNKVKILRRNELDAFCALAFSPELMESEHIQDLHLPLVSFRGVQLATLFMAGVETALLANDACGAPIPWLMCCPWLFFDGKLFHHTLARTTIAKNLFDLCDGEFERFAKAGRMKEAILEGIRVTFARVPNNPKGYRVPQPGIPGCLLAGGLPPICSVARGRISLRNNLPIREIVPRPVPQRGGHLEVAGVIVGQWGANYGQPGRMSHQIAPPPPLRSRGLTTQAPFPRLNQRMFQPRGTPQNPIAAKGKKTQMKATNKKKGAKKNQENCNKNDTTPCDNSEIPNADGFSKLLKKDAKEIIPSLGTQSEDKNTVADKKDVEKGQDVAPQAASQTQ